MKNIEDIYELSPMQQGILFDALYSPEAGGLYLLQISFAWDVELDGPAFERAWRHVINRHPILRTSFYWEEIEKPLQIVHGEIELPLKRLDLSALPDPDRRMRIEDYLKADRLEGFKLDKAPLMRMTLIRTGENSYHFVWSFHHILLEGWSASLVFKDVFTAYRSLCRGEEIRLKRSRPYRDYIMWLQEQDPSQAEAYWRKALAGFAAPTRFGIDRASADMPLPVTDYAEQRISLSSDLTAELQRLARQHRLTVNTLAQGAWALLLSHYSGEEDVAFGVVVSGRQATIEGAESIVGLLVNSLPLRVRTPGKSRLSSWLKGLQDEQLEMLQYEHSSLIDVQGWSEVPRGVPLFESLYVLENWRDDTATFDGYEKIEINDLRSYYRETGYPLAVVVFPSPRLTLELLYDCRRFEAAAIGRMLGHIESLLSGMAADPDQRLSDLRVLTSGERHQLLVEWNDTEQRAEQAACIHHLFERRANQTPDATAVSFAEEHITYDGLNTRSNKLAHRLQALGVGPDARAGICVARSIEMMVGLLAIMKAGGAYVPLDLSYPKERLFFMLEDAGAAVLLTEERFEDALAEHGVPIICLDADWHEIAEESEEPLAVDVTIGNLAYVIYTSGSTGRPKGVQISHSALFNLIAWHCRRFDLSGRDRATQLAGVGFDASVWEVWPYLVSGASLHLPDEDTRTSPEALRDWLTLEQVTISFLPTPLAEAVMTLGWAEGAALRMMLTGGDKLNKYPSSGASYELINNYGPTENSVVATSGDVAREGRLDQGPTIGRPIDYVQVYILDRHQRPAGAGLVGELHIGGRSLARGYLNRAELTAEKFIPSPFDREPGRRLYKTGDLVRHRPDGQIEFVGRADYQVKIRGYRIELGEVEAALRQQAGVEDAVVVAREEGEVGRRLIAYVVGKRAPGAGELRSALEDRLPDYMVPSAFVMMDALPLTQNGKVDRQALPIPDVTTGRSDGLFKTPHTPVEEMLAGIWSRVLGVEKVGVSDNFFEMGGHSLQATRVISQMREVFDLEAPLRWLFEAPTVAELAARVEIARRNKQGLEAPPLVRSSQDVEAPLSFAQQRLWFTEQLVPGTNLYNNSVGVRFKGALNLIALRQSFDEVLRRHESLRTALVSKKGEAFQVAAPSSHLDIPMVDLAALPEDEREMKCRRLARQQSAKAFDLGQAPLMRAALLCMQADEWVVLVTMHHLVTDNWSVGIFVRELGSLYQDFSDSIPSRLPELAIQYIDFARWQRSWLQGEALDAQLGYWKQQLEGAPRLLRLPADRPRPIKRSFRCSSLPLSVPRDLFEKIERLSRQEGVTLFMTLLAAYQTLLFRYTGQDDICVGSPIANRNRAEIEDLIGYFVNILVLRTDLSGNPGFQELLKRVREVTLGAYAHQDLPFETLVDALRPDRNLNHSRLVQATFTFQNAPMRALELPRLTLTPVAIGNQAIVEYDLSLIIAGEAGGLSGNLVYNSDLFDASTIARLLDHFIMILEQATADPERPLLDIQLQRDDSAELYKTTSLIEEYGVHRFML